MRVLSDVRQTITYRRLVRSLGIDPAPLGEEPTMPHERFTKPITPAADGEVTGLYVEVPAPVDEPPTGGPDASGEPSIVRPYISPAPRRELAGWTRIAVTTADGLAHRMFSDHGPRCSVTGPWTPSTIADHKQGPRCRSQHCFPGGES